MIDLEFDLDPSLDNVVEETNLQELFVNSLYNRGLNAVVRLQERFSAVLQPGADEDVGASGKAARNFTTAWVGQSAEWQIGEGNSTPANRIIRSGIPPGSKIPIEKLRRWAADKGIKLYYHENFKDAAGNKRTRRTPNAVLDKLVSRGGTMFERSRWFGRVGLKPESTLKPSQVTMKGLYALRFALWKEGTKRPTANWMGLHPTGSGKFSYPDYVFKKDKDKINQIITDLGLEVAEDIGLGLYGGVK